MSSSIGLHIISPDVIIYQVDEQRKDQRCNYATTSKHCLLNKLGRIPVISTITGVGRVLFGVAQTIVHLACAIFTDRKRHLHEAGLGIKNIIRGVVEAIPVIGNITVTVIDHFKDRKLEELANVEYVNGNYKNRILMFVDGKIIGNAHVGMVESEIFGMLLYKGHVSKDDLPEIIDIAISNERNSIAVKKHYLEAKDSGNASNEQSEPPVQQTDA